MESPEPSEPVVWTLGNFDGVHLGHQALLRRAGTVAERSGAVPGALFFHPHPSTVLGGEPAKELTTRERREVLLRRFGATRVSVQRFDAAFSRLTPSEFVTEVLLQQGQARAVVVGPDFRFGRQRAGNVNTLRDLGQRLSFDVFVVSPVSTGGEKVSSSAIRTHLLAGDVGAARALLGRAHDLDGEVVRGDGRARGLGFPTANLDDLGGLLPGAGVYAVRVQRLDGDLQAGGVMNIGNRPTFGAGRAVEVHLLDVDRDLYGARLRVFFEARLRGEMRFDGPGALVAQIQRDVAQARVLLS